MPNDNQPTRPAVPLAEMLKADDEVGIPDTSGASAIAAVAEDTTGPADITLGTGDDEDEDIPEADDEDTDTALVFVHEPKCLQCGHLVGFAEKKYKSCHFTAGNDMCPAQSIKIAIQLDTKRIVRNFLHAEEEGDTEKLSRLYAALATKPDWGRRQILEDLADARAQKTKR